MKTNTKCVGRILSRFFYLLSLIVIVCGPAMGATYYVSTSGGDTNPGTEDQPWRTIQKAADTMVAGDTVLVRSGTYGPRVLITRSGTAALPINYRVYPGDTVTINNNNNTTFPHALNIEDGVSYIVVDGFNIINSYQQNVWIENSHYVTIQNCLISNSGREGVQIRHSTNCLMENNTIHTTGTRGFNGEGIYLSTYEDGSFSNRSENTIIRGNDIYNTTDENINVKERVINFVIENNHIHDSQIADGGAINVEQPAEPPFDPTPSGGIIRNNTIHNISTRTPYADGNGIKADNGVEVYNNIVYDCQHFGIRVDDIRGFRNLTKIYHNTLYNNGLGAVGVFDGAPTDIRNNIGPSQPGNIPSSDDLFIDPANGNFDLQPGSAAIDLGVDLGISTDVVARVRPMGEGPDMGGYEYPSP